jgi:hypothetical protein
MSSSPEAPAKRSRLTTTRLLVAALVAIVAAGLVTAVYPHLVTHDAPNAVMTATSAVGGGAAIAAPLLIIAAIVRRLAR